MSDYGGRGGSTWKPSGKVTGTDYFTTSAKPKQKRTPPKTPRKPRKQPKLTANSSERISQPVPKSTGSGWSRLRAGAGSAAVVSAVGFVGKQLGKSDIAAKRKSQRYLKDNPTYTGNSYLGKSTWKANTRSARQENKTTERLTVPQSGVAGPPPVSVRPQRSTSSPVAKSRFNQNMAATMKRLNAQPKRSSAMSFKDAFGAARKAHGGAGGVFTYKGEKFQTNIKGEKYVAKPKKVKGHYNNKKKK